MGCGSSREYTVRSSRPRSGSGSSTPTITIDTRSPSRRPSSHKRRSQRYSGVTYVNAVSTPRISYIRDEHPSPTRPIALQPVLDRQPSHRRVVTHGARPSIEAVFRASNPTIRDRSPTTARPSIEERFVAANPRIDSRIPTHYQARTTRPRSAEVPPLAPEPPRTGATAPPRGHVRGFSAGDVQPTQHDREARTVRSDPTPRAGAPRASGASGRGRSSSRASPRAPPVTPNTGAAPLAASEGSRITRRLTYRVRENDHLSAVLQGGGGPSTNAGSRRGREERGEVVRRRSRAPSRARERSQDGLYRDYGFPGHPRR